MISRKTFDLVRSRYPLHASWAIWAAEGRTPKSNISDLSVLDPGANTQLLDTLHTQFVLVGLNVASRPIAAPLANFHDASPRATDFRIRAAFLGTACWGAYMTDVIKDFPETCSGKMTAYLRSHPKFKLAQIESFRIELDAVGAYDATLVPFGRAAERIVRAHLGDRHRIIGIPHYAVYMSAALYRERVHEAFAKSGVKCVQSQFATTRVSTLDRSCSRRLVIRTE